MCGAVNQPLGQAQAQTLAQVQTEARGWLRRGISVTAAMAERETEHCADVRDSMHRRPLSPLSSLTSALT